MFLRNRFARTIAIAILVVALSMTVASGQLPIPVQGQRGGGQGQQGGQGQRGQRGGTQAAAPAVTPVVSPLATVSAEIIGPGKFYETLMELKPTDDLAYFKYVTKEYFVSGTANGQPYKTRIVIRRPADNAKFTGLVLAESMHPSGNP